MRELFRVRVFWWGMPEYVRIVAEGLVRNGFPDS